MAPDYDVECESLLHTYSEQGARAFLARARLRGNEWFMWHCPWREHWHVTERPLEEMAALRTDVETALNDEQADG